MYCLYMSLPWLDVLFTLLLITHENMTFLMALIRTTATTIFFIKTTLSTFFLRTNLGASSPVEQHAHSRVAAPVGRRSGVNPRADW